MDTLSLTTPASEAPPGDLVRFEVDPALCVGCVACLNVFPRLFAMQDDDKAVVVAAERAAEVQTTRVTGCCPVGAIRVAAGPEPAAGPTLAVVPGWEAVWEQLRDVPEDLPERERRYGRVHRLLQLGELWDFQVELPRRPPLHRLVAMHGVPPGPPEYVCHVVQIAPDVLSVRGRLVDPTLRHLTGKLNSCPIGFRVDCRFPAAVGTSFHRLDHDSLHVYALPEGIATPLVALAAAIRAQLAQS